MDIEKENTNRMATEPVGRLLVSVGLPIVFSMMLQAVYNIVDSAYLSRMREAGEEALTALGLAFPIQLFMIAVAVGTGVGANALLSKSLGQGNRKKASETAGNAVFMCLVISAVFLLFGLFGVPSYVNSQNAGGNISETVLLMAIDYLRICCCISFGIVFFTVYEKILQAMGRSLYSTIAQVTGAVVNIVMDPIMIYGWFGCPEMGVKGAAYATVLGQIASALLAFAFHMKLDHEIDQSLRWMKPQLRILREIYAIGLPAIISQALLTVMTYGLNLILGQMAEVGENAVTVYGLYCKIQQMIIFAAVGVRDAITPVVSFNFGMKNRERILGGIRGGLIFAAVLMAIGTVVIEVFAGAIADWFALSDLTNRMCVDCMQIISAAFLFSGLSIAFQGVFQAVECGIESLLISVGRQVVFVLPPAWALSRLVTGAENASVVWWAFLTGETLTLACALFMYRRVRLRKLETIAQSETADAAPVKAGA